MSKIESIEVVKPALSAAQLGGVAEEINATHAAAKTHAKLAVVFAIRTGVLCEQAKDALAHKEFGPWLQKNCPHVSDRTARNYMNLVRTIKSETVSLLGSGAKTETVSVLPEAELLAPDFLQRIAGNEGYRDEIGEKISNVAGDGSLNDLYKDWGVTHGPRNVDQDGKRVHYPEKKTKLSPEQVAKANRAAGVARIRDALKVLKAALDDKQLRRWLEPKDWIDLEKLAKDRLDQLAKLAGAAAAAAKKGAQS